MATTIKIGHASISENNTAYGQAGDSTGKEVYVNPNFSIISMSPTVLLRPNSSALAEASALACEAGCENDNIGYSQNGRNTLYSYASAVNFDLAKVSTKCNTDCSAFMAVCAIAGGASITYVTNAPTTTNMRTKFKQSGDYTVLTDSKHLTTTDYLKRGDILVKEGSHTVMVLENGNHYKEEPEQDDSGSSTGITQTKKIRTHLLDVSITSIKDTSATVEFKVIESINNVNKILTDISKWSYCLSITSLSNLKTTEYNFTKNEYKVTGLTAGQSYILNISAKKSTGNIAFCSTSMIFTTEQKTNIPNLPVVDFGDKTNTKPFIQVNKIYIKDKDGFKQAVIYKNK